MNDCKGCRESVRVSKSAIMKMISQLESSGRELADDKLYKDRLNICHSCPSLQYKTTCKHSGALIELRAKLLARTCSHPDMPKW